LGRAWQDLKRESIQQAVIRLMCREGLKSVTMERVAQEVGIAKGTVYLHYRDKQDLLEAVKDAALEPMIEEMEKLLGANARIRALSINQSHERQSEALRDQRRDPIVILERRVLPAPRVVAPVARPRSPPRSPGPAPPGTTGD